MPKFTLAENDTPEIDPDALQVKLTGFGVDPDDLTKEPENVQLPDEDEHVTDDNVLAEDTENASTSSPDLEEIPLTQRNEPAVSAEEVEVLSTAVDEKDAEAEIQDIEAMLRGNRKTRAQKKAEKEMADRAKAERKAKERYLCHWSRSSRRPSRRIFYRLLSGGLRFDAFNRNDDG